MALLDLQSFHNSAVAMNRLSAHPTATMPIVGTTGAGARVEPVESARNASLGFARIRASRTVPVNCVETTDAGTPVGSASKEKNALKVYAQLPIANPNALENSVVMTDAAASAVPVHLTKIATSLVNALKPLHVYPTASTNSVVRTDVAGNGAVDLLEGQRLDRSRQRGAETGKHNLSEFAQTCDDGHFSQLVSQGDTAVGKPTRTARAAPRAELARASLFACMHTSRFFGGHRRAARWSSLT